MAGLAIDFDLMQVEREGRVLFLPPIPFKILATLVRESPRVVPRELLEREVWGDSPPDSDALRAHMHTLRATVDRPFDRPLIHTVHGVGYRFADEPERGATG